MLRALSSSNKTFFAIAADVTTRFDQVFWFGDFNFRLSKERAEVENILSRIEGSEMSPLLEHDQLTKEINDGTLAYFPLKTWEELKSFRGCAE